MHVPTSQTGSVLAAATNQCCCKTALVRCRNHKTARRADVFSVPEGENPAPPIIGGHVNLFCENCTTKNQRMHWPAALAPQLKENQCLRQRKCRNRHWTCISGEAVVHLLSSRPEIDSLLGRLIAPLLRCPRQCQISRRFHSSVSASMPLPRLFQQACSLSSIIMAAL